MPTTPSAHRKFGPVRCLFDGRSFQLMEQGAVAGGWNTVSHAAACKETPWAGRWLTTGYNEYATLGRFSEVVSKWLK